LTRQTGTTTALSHRSALPGVQASIAKAPAELQRAIPNPTRVLDEQQDFAKQLQQMRVAF
jgi:hypothetical protein